MLTHFKTFYVAKQLHVSASKNILIFGTKYFRMEVISVWNSVTFLGHPVVKFVIFTGLSVTKIAILFQSFLGKWSR